MSEFHQQLRRLIQQDVGGRGLATHPDENLFTHCIDDFEQACRSIAETTSPEIGIVTGFFIPDSKPPAGETDGPLGALYLARALAPIGVKVHLITDDFCVKAFEAGLSATGLANQVGISTIDAWQNQNLTHLIALERAGPNHTLDSIDEQSRELFGQCVAPEDRDQCFTMRGKNVTARMGEAHRLFEETNAVTIGIGDGGNEVGMGRIPWEIIRRNVPGGEKVACRIATDLLIVCGVSNWGAYALALGALDLRDEPISEQLLDENLEHSLLELMVREGPLVDGVLARHQASVDGLSWERYIEPLRRMGGM